MPPVIFDAPDFHHSKHRPKDWCFDKDSNQSYTPSVSPTPRFNGSRHRHEVKLLEQDQSANHVNILESMAGYTRTRNNSQFADRSSTSHKDVEYSPEVDEDAERLETEPSLSRKLVGQRVNTTIVRRGKSSEKKASDTISYNQRHAKYITQEAGNHSDYDSSSALGDYFIGSECSPRGDSDESALGELFIIDSPDHMVVNNSPSASNSVLGDLFSSESNSANNSDVDSTLGELFVDSDSLAPPNALQLYNDASASEDNSVRLGDLFSESGDIDNSQVDNDETNTTLGTAGPLIRSIRLDVDLPAPVTTSSSVGMPAPANASLSTIFAGETGLCMVNVTSAHPMFRLVKNYEQKVTTNNQLTEENTMLQEKVTQLQRQLALAELLQEEDTKPKKPQRKKGNSQKSGAASVGGSSTPSDPLALLTETVANLQKAMTEERETVANLQKAMTEQREKVANLQKAMTEEREAWQKVEATLASERDERLWQLSDVARRTGELEQWAVTADPEILDRIRLRSLLDEGQAKLARFAGLVSEKDTTSYASMTWRLKLKGEDGEPAADDARLRTARSLLTGRGGIIPQAIQVGDNPWRSNETLNTNRVVSNTSDHLTSELQSHGSDKKS
ncbi:hypothetical protein JR316_0011685 [Psilocybe cubensis]|uniref:Uncharacterized protein n=2 Tax=Psilocybe cubensis TaxID=181762 RepID=A0A8H7XUR0_PSICU|nr:hypothetical protein JR316_0011685 [Psilocybe cubensis]KAH9476114.1 hypothetical protein JR316_0011685 [Psilocybe cubensis]